MENRKKHFIISVAYYSVIFAMIFIFYRFLVGYLLPFVVAFLLVFLLRKPSVLLSKKLKIKTKYINILLVLASFLMLFLLVGAAVFFVVHSIEKSNIIGWLENTLTGLSQGFNSLVLRLEKYLPESAKSAALSFAANIPQQIADFVGKNVPNLLTKTVSNVPKFLLSFAVTVAAGCYFANEYEPLKNFFMSVVPNDKILLIKKIKSIMATNILRMFKGYGVISLIIFSLCFLTLLIIGNKNAFLWAVFITFVDLLPVLGAGTVIIPWAVISAFSGDFFYLAVLVFLYVCTLAVHHILEPKFVGKSVGVPPLICLLVMFITLKIFGFLGMIISLLSLVTVVNLYKTEAVAN